MRETRPSYSKGLLTDRRVELVLVAFPLSTRVINEAVSLMAEEIRRVAA